MSTSTKTRFAPSPTGHLHLGNARTALFNALLAFRDQGSFLLRIEDTDAERSRPDFVEALKADLRWLLIPWQEGPEADAGNGPYAQSERSDIYKRYYRELEEKGLAYPCFCSPKELELSRRAQRASGKPPRYSGKCAHLSADEVAAKREQGLEATLRFRVSDEAVSEFTDIVRGPQRFPGSEIGDFIIRRADGTPAFFFCNAVDDALMGVTHVLRGEDHLTNTPRQLMILEALGLPQPQYGHITLIVGSDGAPLSKRHGSRSLNELRDEGFFPEAVCNYLARLGHKYESDDFMSLDALADGFSAERLGRSPARFDADQLHYWQQQAVAHLDEEALWAWMGEAVHERVPAESRAAFIEAIRPNVTFPADAVMWARNLFGDEAAPDEAARGAISEAGSDFFAAAIAALESNGTDFKALANAVKSETGAKGKGLFMPLRAALTGRTGGPEMGQVLPLMGIERARRRLEMAKSL